MLKLMILDSGTETPAAKVCMIMTLGQIEYLRNAYGVKFRLRFKKPMIVQEVIK